MADRVIKYHFQQAHDFTTGREFAVRSVVLHSSDGREAGDVATLTSGGVSSHWYVTRAGKVYRFVKDEDTAWHAGKVFDRERFGNGASIGIEQEHYDPDAHDGHPNNEDWPELQVTTVAQIVAYLLQKFGLTTDAITTHAAIAKPAGRKQDPFGYPMDSFKQQVEQFAADVWSIEEI